MAEEGGKKVGKHISCHKNVSSSLTRKKKKTPRKRRERVWERKYKADQEEGGGGPERAVNEPHLRLRKIQRRGLKKDHCRCGKEGRNSRRRKYFRRSARRNVHILLDIHPTRSNQNESLCRHNYIWEKRRPKTGNWTVLEKESFMKKALGGKVNLTRLSAVCLEKIGAPGIGRTYQIRKRETKRTAISKEKGSDGV